MLVAARAGLLVPAGRDGWTLADLAAEVRTPAVVVTGRVRTRANHHPLARGAGDFRAAAATCWS